MPYGMYLSAEGAMAQAQRLEVIANNLANVNTPGFKRDVPSFQARLAEAILQGEDQQGTGTENQVGGGIMMADVETDFSAGTFKHTDIPTDFAVGGDGFFQVRTSTGDTLLTRAGNFALNGSGEIVTQDHLSHLLSAGGEPISVLPGEPWRVTNDGFVVQAGGAVPIGLVAPADVAALTKVGENLFRVEGQTTPLAPGQRVVRQGYLELSAVNPTREMMALIETSRAFEANTKLIQSQDHMLEALISRVLQS